MNKKAQQEIVGFVLIVVVVMVGLMIYLTMSLRSSPENEGSLEVANALDALMKQTTECAVVYVPNYDTFEDLFKSAYKGESCTNLNKPAREYLEEASREVLTDMMASESSVMAYELQFAEKNSEGAIQGLLMFTEGNCTGNVNSAMRTLSSGSERLLITLKTCTF
ncbi:hypothetical protein KAS08_01845 [Candidatus Pacearchaeota archaeon]|nr:hypothetical protein [Candidatus Pacearchaeota archaeon]